MATIKPNKNKQISYTVNQSLGLNCDNELELKKGEFVDVSDYRITPDYRLEKREGWKYLLNAINAINPISHMIYCKLSSAHYAPEHKYYIYYTSISSTYNFNLSLYKFDIENKTSSEILPDFGLVAQTYLIIQKNGILYIYGYLLDSDYKIMEYNGYLVTYGDLGTTPLTYINCTPNLSSLTPHQPINLLNLQRKIHYVADGTSVWYYLAEQAITIDSVTVDNVSTGAFTHSTTEGRIGFTTSPTIGQEVEITYTSTATSQSDLITNCTKSMFYGGANDMDLFVWGNPLHPNTVYHTYGGDVEFFGDINYDTFGDGNVTDVVAQNETQVIFTDKNIFSSVGTVTKENVMVGTASQTKYTVEYNKKIIQYARGNKAGFDVQIINNCSTFLSNDNAIYQLTMPNYKDERALDYISGKVQKPLILEDLTGGINIDWESRGEYWLIANGTAYIWHYRLKNPYSDDWRVWSKFENIPATSYVLIDDELYFGTSDGAIAKFDKTMTYDSSLSVTGVETKTPIEAYVLLPYNGFGVDYLKKSISKMFITLGVSDINDSYIRVEYWTNNNTIANSFEFFLEAGEPPKEFFQEISANDFEYFKIKIISDKLDCNGTLLNYTLKIQLNGEVN